MTTVTKMAKKRFVATWLKWYRADKKQLQVFHELERAERLNWETTRLHNRLESADEKLAAVEKQLEDLYVKFEIPENMQKICREDLEAAGIGYAVGDQHIDTYHNIKHLYPSNNQEEA